MNYCYALRSILILIKFYSCINCSYIGRKKSYDYKVQMLQAFVLDDVQRTSDDTSFDCNAYNIILCYERSALQCNYY